MTKFLTYEEGYFRYKLSQVQEVYTREIAFSLAKVYTQKIVLAMIKYRKMVKIRMMIEKFVNWPIRLSLYLDF